MPDSDTDSPSRLSSRFRTMSSGFQTMSFFSQLIFLALLFGATFAADSTASTCPPGSFFSKQKCNLCPVGTYQLDSGKTSCLPCPAGTYGTISGAQGVDICTPCPASTFSTTTAATSPETCRPCPRFSSSYPASTFCTSCPVNFVIDFERRNKCEDCGFDSFTAQRGSNECLFCPDGQRIVDKRATPRCEKCPPGSEASDTECRPCNGAEGFFNDGTFDSCKFCPAGTQGFPLRGARTCVPCPRGTAADNGVSDSSFRVCRPCPSGFNTDITGAEKCFPDDTPCPDNFFRAASGACMRCDKSQGYNAKKKICEPCKKNFGSDGGLDSQCKRCVAPKVSGLFGAGCQCGEGSIRTLEGGCEICPAGTSTEVQPNSCLPCRPGSFSASPGSAACTLCPSGFVQPEPGQSKCVRCPKGLLARQWRRFTGLRFNAEFDENRCVEPQSLCPPDYKRVNDVDGLRIACNPPSCPQGTFKVVQKASSKDCGFFCPTEDVIYCETCPKTHRYDSKLNTCVVCQQNEVSNGGLTTECRKCGKGEIEVNGKCACRSLMSVKVSERQGITWRGWLYSRGLIDGRCQVCPPGTSGIEYEGVCRPCSAGTFQSEKGSYLCIECAEGTFSQSGATKCEPCPRGTTSFSIAGVGSSNCVRPGSL